MKFKIRKKQGYTDAIIKDDKTYVIKNPKSKDYQEYLEWIKEGNIAPDYVEPEPVPTDEQTEKRNRREQVAAFREHLISGGDLTKVQIRKFMIAVIDRIM